MSRDNIDDRFDDRPRRRDGGSSNKTLFIILGIVGGMIGLSCLGCAGFFGWGVFQAKKGIEQLADSFGPSLAADAFFTNVKLNPRTAYVSTSQGFKDRQSEAEFKKFVDAHPILTEQVATTQVSRTNADIEPGVPVTLIYTLSATSPFAANDDSEPGFGPPGSKIGNRPRVNQPVQNNKPDDGTVTLTLVKEGDQWKVDDIQVK